MTLLSLIATLGHKITLLHMLGNQTVLNRPWEQLNVIQMKFSMYHIVLPSMPLETLCLADPTPMVRLWYAYATIYLHTLPVIVHTEKFNTLKE